MYLTHWARLNKTLQHDIGIAVAALDYLSSIHEVLSSPILMEESESKNIIDIATNDKLTGLVTRDVFDFAVDKELKQIERSEETVSLAMFDIDDFKQVNDKYGHQQGDQILAAIGKTISRTFATWIPRYVMAVKNWRS